MQAVNAKRAFRIWYVIAANKSSCLWCSCNMFARQSISVDSLVFVLKNITKRQALERRLLRRRISFLNFVIHPHNCLGLFRYICHSCWINSCSYSNFDKIISVVKSFVIETSRKFFRFLIKKPSEQALRVSRGMAASRVLRVCSSWPSRCDRSVRWGWLFLDDILRRVAARRRRRPLRRVSLQYRPSCWIRPPHDVLTMPLWLFGYILLSKRMGLFWTTLSFIVAEIYCTWRYCSLFFFHLHPTHLFA